MIKQQHGSVPADPASLRSAANTVVRRLTGNAWW